MKFRHLPIIFFFLCSISLAQEKKFIAINKGQIEYRKLNDTGERFRGVGINFNVAYFKYIYKSTEPDTTITRDNVDSRIGITLLSGKEIHKSEKWSLWLIPSLGIAPYINYRLNEPKNSRFLLNVSGSFSAEIQYQISEKLTFAQSTSLFNSYLTISSTFYTNRSKRLEYRFSGRILGSSLSLTQVGLIYQFK